MIGRHPDMAHPAGTGHLQAHWHRFNDRYFQGRLAPIEIAWSDRLTSSAGMFEYRAGPRHAQRCASHRSIRLSVPLHERQHHRELLSTLAHEMIHQWQYDVLRRRPNHGRDFCRKLHEMNRDGLGVTIRHDLATAGQFLSQYAWRCMQCGELYHRQRRTIRPRQHRCGACRGALRALSPAQLKRQLEQTNSSGGSRQPRRRRHGPASVGGPPQLEIQFGLE